MTAPLLIDTCAAIYIFGNEPMTDAAVAAMDHAADASILTYVSPITAWEIGQLISKGRLKSTMSAQRWFQRLIGTWGFRLADMPPELLMASWYLPGNLNRDPADRIIAATAREYGFTVLTRDAELLRYARDGHIAALAC
ncbi:MAG TPA: type II toxin-antitoxin system VapC family toxin [Rhizomicrobium sp.]